VTDRELYTPGEANIARVEKVREQNGKEKWTLVLVRELRHSPEQVWQAITRICASGRPSTPMATWARLEPG
jgi:hypothetical protein